MSTANLNASGIFQRLLIGDSSMNASKFFVTAIATASIVGVVGLAYAQTNTTNDRTNPSNNATQSNPAVQPSVTDPSTSNTGTNNGGMNNGTMNNGSNSQMPGNRTNNSRNGISQNSTGTTSTDSEPALNQRPARSDRN